MPVLSNVKRIFLDLDGPLLDGRQKHYNTYKKILDYYGYKPIDIEAYWNKKRASLNRRDLLNLSGAIDIYDDFLKDWIALIETPEMLAFDLVQEGAIDCLIEWKKKELTVTLVTMRKNKRGLEGQLAALGLKRYLDMVLVCDHAQGGEGKAATVRGMFPDVDLTRNSVWIGDTEVDWEAAGILKCPIFLVSNGIRDQEYLKSLGGGFIAASINDLVG